MEKQMSNLVSSIIIIGLVFLVAATSAFFLNSFRNSIDLVDTSSTQTILTSSTDTLSPVGNGITSSEVNANNLTWLEFDGINDYVRITNKTAFEPFLYDNRSSFSIWFKGNDWTTGFGGDNNRYILGKDSDWGRFYLSLGGSSVSNKTAFYTIKSPSTSVLNISSNLINRYDWHNIQIVFEGGTMSSYLDGVRVGSTALEHFNDTSDAFLKLGVGRDSYYFNGSIDDFRTTNALIYPAEVVSIYQDNKNGADKIFIPVMMRHDIGRTGYQSETYFREELSWLNDNDFETITDKEYYDWRFNNNFTMPNKPIMYIFDDGFKNVSELIAPIMEEYGYKGIMSIVTTRIGSNESLYMNWSNVNDTVDNYNWSIASHSSTHCNMGTAFSFTNCTSTEDRRSNMSESKQDIIDNTGFTPVTFVHPFNSWNSTTIEDCRLNYTFCFGSSNSYETGVYVTENSDLDTGYGFQRLNAEEYSNTNKFSYIFNYSLRDDNIIQYNLNENNGTTVHDSSGNSNDGTISGATWATDGALNTLTAITDYTINPTTGLFTLVNSDYKWSELLTSWNYDSEDSKTRLILKDGEDAIGDNSSIMGILLTIVLLGVVLTIIIKTFMNKTNRI